MPRLEPPATAACLFIKVLTAQDNKQLYFSPSAGFVHTSQTFFFFCIDISHSAGSLNGIQYAPHNSQRRHLSRLHQLPENKHVTRFHLDVNSSRQQHFSPKREARRIFLEGTNTCPGITDSPLIMEASRHVQNNAVGLYKKRN